MDLEFVANEVVNNFLRNIKKKSYTSKWLTRKVIEIIYHKYFIKTFTT